MLGKVKFGPGLEPPLGLGHDDPPPESVPSALYKDAEAWRSVVGIGHGGLSPGPLGPSSSLISLVATAKMSIDDEESSGGLETVAGAAEKRRRVDIIPFLWVEKHGKIQKGTITHKVYGHVHGRCDQIATQKTKDDSASQQGALVEGYSSTLNGVPFFGL